MNAKEAEEIAWQIVIVFECADGTHGADRAVPVANAAMETFRAILKHPKIKRAFDVLYRPPNTPEHRTEARDGNS